MINLTAEEVAENLDAIVNLVKDVPVRITDETGKIAIMISFEVYTKLLEAENQIKGVQLTTEPETKRGVAN